jgi:hypothetical protein
MLSKESLDEYRRMSPSERLLLALRMTHDNFASLVSGSEQTVARRFALLRRENDLRNANMLASIARTRSVR